MLRDGRGSLDNSIKDGTLKGFYVSVFASEPCSIDIENPMVLQYLKVKGFRIVRFCEGVRMILLFVFGTNLSKLLCTCLRVTRL